MLVDRTWNAEDVRLTSVFSCRLHTLDDFVSRSAAELLRHKYCDVYFVKYLKYSAGFQTLEMLYHPDMGWLYAYRGIGISSGRVTDMPRDIHAAYPSRKDYIRDQMILMYSHMPPGKHGYQQHITKARALWCTGNKRLPGLEGIIRRGTQLVESGMLDAFVHSPMPLAC